jgi:hypothetical protein
VDSLLKVFLELRFEFFLSLSWPSGHDVQNGVSDIVNGIDSVSVDFRVIFKSRR